MKIDLHNHTTRCNHATGSIDEYIKRAIDLGIDIYGFSEHAPIKGGFDSRYRLSVDDLDEYERDILDARERYKDSIDIRLAYEVDFIAGYLEDRVIEADVDYLIGSIHFIDRWGFDNPEFIGGWSSRDIDEVWEEYFSAVRAMADSGLFNIVGHLDLIKIFKFMPKRDIRLIAKDALMAIKKSNMALELNSAGYRKPIEEPYPSRELLEVAYELEIPITFGSDAHSIEQIGSRYRDIIDLAKSIGYSKAVSFKHKDREVFEI